MNRSHIVSGHSILQSPNCMGRSHIVNGQVTNTFYILPAPNYMNRSHIVNGHSILQSPNCMGRSHIVNGQVAYILNFTVTLLYEQESHFKWTFYSSVT